jgi:hypothetical protein
LVEVKKNSVLPGNEHFIVAQQATQVYYLAYPCKFTGSLVDWGVVYKVPPCTKLPTPSDEDYNIIDPNINIDEFFQEDGLPGTFEIVIGDEDYHSDNIEIDVEEVSNENDLELLNHFNIDSDSDNDVPLNMLHEDDTIYDGTSDDDIVEPPEGDPNCMCCIIVMFYLHLICYIYIIVDTNFCI